MDAAWHAQLNRAKRVYPHGAEQRSSNALRIQVSQSEVSHSLTWRVPMAARGGQHELPSVHNHLHEQRAGRLCAPQHDPLGDSALHMDVSSRIVFEGNQIVCMQKGKFPHGNSVSFYDFYLHPYSQSYSYSHNNPSRQPNNDPTNWAWHESWTTDGPIGGAGIGKVGVVDGARVSLPFLALLPVIPIAGTLAVVVAGPGLGQYE